MSDGKILIVCVIVFVVGYFIGYCSGVNEYRDPKNDNSEDLDYHI